ncbi:TetR/AcrR family transcriptional regulator C-terminal ligand-binding domain-containing protein [Streptomyces sp. NPDC002734]|uniref:TetR/AcrR family transcriptional regulator n=1 Tax=Streptomyces sp. NPDC002734 TaxID=3154426 RepID=UPI00331722AC
MRADVHGAVGALLRERPVGELTIAQIAERSGVHLGTLYRRWGTLEGILLDVVTEQFDQSSPMPDTGTLAEDLRVYAREAAEDLAGPQGELLLRTLVAVRLGADGATEPPPAVTRRFDELGKLLDRAAARGENPPSVQEVYEVVIAPLVAGLLFGTEPQGPEAVDGLLDRLDRLTRAGGQGSDSSQD